MTAVLPTRLCLYLVRTSLPRHMQSIYTSNVAVVRWAVGVVAAVWRSLILTVLSIIICYIGQLYAIPSAAPFRIYRRAFAIHPRLAGRRG